jgi:SAM-dependent methyltransferase
MSHGAPTVLVNQYRQAAIDGKVSTNSYKGLKIHALPGLHDFVGELAAKHLRPGTLLDLAAGSGAMSLRMQDLGFQVTATDYVPENFRLHGSVPFTHGDLNEPFSKGYGEPFGNIIASEIIEHLENPRHFARECHRLLIPGGRMILTTPNVDSPASKASFLRSGRFAWFTEHDYREQGHITPLTQWQIGDCFREAGFSFVWRGSFGQEHSRLAGSPRLRWLAKLACALSSTEDGLSGEIFVAVLEKTGLGAR